MKKPARKRGKGETPETLEGILQELADSAQRIAGAAGVSVPGKRASASLMLGRKTIAKATATVTPARCALKTLARNKHG